jgi:hypothetical protein
MTITTSTDKPTTEPRPFDREAAIRQMRAAGRDEMIHYSGASHRDPIAWHITRAWLDDPSCTESECKSIALKAAWNTDLSPEQIRASNPGMR